MAAEEHLKILRQGVEVWNDWRDENPGLHPDLSGADLRGVDLFEANLIWANLSKAKLGGADLTGAHLSKASLRGADLSGANLERANLERANLERANLFRANLFRANLSTAKLGGADLPGAYLAEANLRGAILERTTLVMAQLVGTDFRNATLTGSAIYGASVWGIKVNEGTKQRNLIITDRREPAITVDNVEVAQFIYLLLNNQAIRKVIDTIGRKLVLILGRFTPERKRVLDALRDELRIRDYLPVVFDFEKPSSRYLTETISTLAHMARFIIADLTEAKSLPQELGVIVPNLPSVVVQPIILLG